MIENKYLRICAEVEACDPLKKMIARELTCDDCKLNMDEVRRILNNSDLVKGKSFSCRWRRTSCDYVTLPPN
jgi:hypothetical protein